MPRVVVGPGVFVSALIAPKGTPAQLLDLLLEQRFELVADLAAVATVLRDPSDPIAVTRDPNDDHLVELAMAAQQRELVKHPNHKPDLVVARVGPRPARRPTSASVPARAPTAAAA